MVECPMNSCTAFGFSPAAINSDANVCRHWCIVIRSRFAASHALSAAVLTVDGTKGSEAVRPSTRSGPRAAGRQQGFVQMVGQDPKERGCACAALRLPVYLALVLVPCALAPDGSRAKVDARAPESL